MQLLRAHKMPTAPVTVWQCTDAPINEHYCHDTGKAAGRAAFLLCKKVRIVGDASSVEVFVNDGTLVFSTRIYPEAYGVTVDASGVSVTYHTLNI